MITMRAWVLDAPGGPEAFHFRELPVPEPVAGQVLIRIRAFGLNRSEWFTRIGDSPDVKLPRVLGIECVGEVEAAPGGEYDKGQRVAAMMGGMGREFDGSYAEFTCVPATNLFPIDTSLGWAELGALPEMLQTTHGSLHTGLGAQAGDTILIRGGTSSIGLATLALAKASGIGVVTTTRSEKKRESLLAAGADEVFVDSGVLVDEVRRHYPEGVDHALDLIGATTLLDSMQCVRPGGVVCMTGILGGSWELENFRPMEHIPSGVRLTCYSGGAADITVEELRRYVKLVETGELTVQNGPVWEFEQLRDAHATMDANTAGGKMVVVVPPGPAR
ncbi:MAG: zinc-binding alcohol dehydrogenase family protein [Chloroflexi bacterium]|nr:zinc-binding alcohol dehydrogenase family protein [Chloroflexota bacterium]